MDPPGTIGGFTGAGRFLRSRDALREPARLPALATSPAPCRPSVRTDRDTPAPPGCGACWCPAAGYRPALVAAVHARGRLAVQDRKSTRLNSSHVAISYAVFCLKKKR